MGEALSGELVEALKGLDTCSVSNAIERLTERLRNVGFAGRTIRRITASPTSLVGFAATVRIRCSHPPMPGQVYSDRTDWWNYILTVPTPRVIVIEDMDAEPGMGTLLGEVHAHILQALDCVGGITNGAVRDVSAVETMGFQLFAASLGVSHSYAHIIEFGGTVDVEGMTVHSGDLLHGDIHGVLTVPKEIVGEIPATVAKIREHERQIIDLCHSPEFSLEKLRHAVKAS